MTGRFSALRVRSLRPLRLWGGFFVLALAALFLSSSALAQTIAGKPYRKLDTREATRSAMVRELTGSSVELGPWHMLRAFDHPKGDQDIARSYPPESELPGMVAGGPGPDLTAAWVGKGGDPIRWEQVAEEPDIGGLGGAKPLDFRDGLDDALGELAVGYLYRRIVAAADTELPVTMGSDDGLRVWLNSEMLIDANVARGLDPASHSLALGLRKGVNHLFIKVSQGRLQWEFAMRALSQLDPVAEAELDWQLDSDFPDAESRYYRIATIPAPRDAVVEVGGVDVMPAPDGRPAITTRRGDVFLIDNAYDLPASRARFGLYASGLQEPLGLAIRPDRSDPSAVARLALVTAQRSELTALIDTDGDDRADAFRTLCDDWKLSGNYHEYAFGPKFDAAGNAYVTLNLAHTGGETVMGATVPTRGWCVKVAPSGEMTMVADGLRSPDGIGTGPDGQMFYTDNQGDYVATNKLSHLIPGSFHGHQASLRFREGYGETWRADGKPVPDITWPAVWFPYKKMGQSASDILLDDTRGAFGPFTGQLFVGEQTYAAVYRVFLEKVDGVYQGACFPFKDNFASGVHRMAWARPGMAPSLDQGRASMFVGMTDRGWGSTGAKRFGLQRLVWTGLVPFEIGTMQVRPDGFMLTFTRPLAPDAADLSKFRMSSYTYDYHPDYGSPEVDTKELKITGVQVLRGEGGQPTILWLGVEGLRSGGMGYVHELHIDGLLSAPDDSGSREPLLHPRAYYTLQRLPR